MVKMVYGRDQVIFKKKPKKKQKTKKGWGISLLGEAHGL